MLLFLSGADMQPEAVLATWPASQFLARARLAARPLDAVPPPASARYEQWGILIEAPDAHETGEARVVITDDGRELEAVVVPPDDADAVAVLAAARYWELPPAYVSHLAELAAVPPEDYFY